MVEADTDTDNDVMTMTDTDIYVMTVADTGTDTHKTGLYYRYRCRYYRHISTLNARKYTIFYILEYKREEH